MYISGNGDIGMVKESGDRRVVRTKKLIRNALSQLIEEKGFNDISITDITSKADINRGTFYLHYTDKYDLLEKIENEIIEEIVCNCKSLAELDMINTDFTNKPIPSMIKVFEYLKENAVFMKAILGPKGDMTFQHKLKGLIQNCLFQSNAIPIKKENMQVPETYFIAYVLSAHLGVIQQWLENDMEKSPEEMALILSKMFLLGPFKSSGIKIS